MALRTKLQAEIEANKITPKVAEVFLQLYDSYVESLEGTHHDIKDYEYLFFNLLELVEKQLASPFCFEPYHAKVTSPYDYYSFGLEFARPLVDEKKSHVHRLENVAKISSQLKAGENAILYANHQTELDPQLLSLALEEVHSDIGSEIIFVAGDRVLTDPLAVPFSMGRNLLCIYSKRHIDNPPEKKAEKLAHNQKTMKRMRDLLAGGGRCIYAALSGGRDRPNEEGIVEIAPFDPNSLEMFRLMAKESGRTTHFYTLAMVTYDILPPPDTIEKEIGERRKLSREGASFAFGDEINLDSYPGSDIADRKLRREALAKHVWNLVYEDYQYLKGHHD